MAHTTPDTFETLHNLTPQSFLTRASIELKRAERYRVFIALVVYELDAVCDKLLVSAEEFAAEVRALVEANVRACDYISVVSRTSLHILFPETSRQGAESAGKRISELITKFAEQRFNHAVGEVLPVEMVSFPDAAGARSFPAIINDLAASCVN